MVDCTRIMYPSLRRATSGVPTQPVALLTHTYTPVSPLKPRRPTHTQTPGFRKEGRSCSPYAEELDGRGGGREVVRKRRMLRGKSTSFRTEHSRCESDGSVSERKMTPHRPTVASTFHRLTPHPSYPRPRMPPKHTGSLTDRNHPTHHSWLLPPSDNSPSPLRTSKQLLLALKQSQQQGGTAGEAGKSLFLAVKPVPNLDLTKVGQGGGGGEGYGKGDERSFVRRRTRRVEFWNDYLELVCVGKGHKNTVTDVCMGAEGLITTSIDCHIGRWRVPKSAWEPYKASTLDIISGSVLSPSSLSLSHHGPIPSLCPLPQSRFATISTDCSLKAVPT